MDPASQCSADSGDGMMISAPPWLFEMVEKSEPEKGATAQVASSVAVSTAQTSTAPSSYIDAAVDREIETLRRATPGIRNDTLNRASYALGTMVGAEWITRVRAEAELRAAAFAIGLEEPEVSRTILSGLEDGIVHPREPVEESTKGEILGSRHTSNFEPPNGTAGSGQKTVASPSGSGSQVEITWTSTITSKPIDYLWKRRLARGKLTVIGGDPGIGKGMVGIDIAAHLSTGTRWPDGAECPTVKVALLTGEDDPADTINPRLEMAGADRTKVAVIGRIEDPKTGQKRRVSLDTDAELLISQVRAAGAEILIIDPLSSYVGGNVNSFRDTDMRRVLDPLSEAAQRARVAILIVAHLTKAPGNNKALYRFQGNIANVAAARFVFLIAAHPNTPDLRVLAWAKGNVSARASSLTFHIEAVLNEDLKEDIGRVVWDRSIEMTADELLGPEKKGGAADRAADFLLDYLADGTQYSDGIFEAAAAKSIGKRSIWEAKDQLHIRAAKHLHGAWYWALPDQYGPPIDRHTSDQGQQVLNRVDGTDTLRHTSDQNDPPTSTISSSRESLGSVSKHVGVLNKGDGDGCRLVENENGSWSCDTHQMTLSSGNCPKASPAQQPPLETAPLALEDSEAPVVKPKPKRKRRPASEEKV